MDNSTTISPIPESDLILNPDGSVYHLGLRPEHLTNTIITVGDPERVKKVSQHFDKITFKTAKREFVSHKGIYKGKEVLVVSTGIGTDNVEIVLTELDILANIDLSTRTPKKEHRQLSVVRIGTSGGIQADIPLDSMVASEFGIGLDPLAQFYEVPFDSNENETARAFSEATGLTNQAYCIKGSATLKEKIAFDMITGNTVTCPGFYAPQGRRIRAATLLPNFLNTVRDFNLNGFKVTNFEMETAGYYALCRTLGHQALSLNAIVAQREQKSFTINADKTIEELIVKTLERI